MKSLKHLISLSLTLLLLQIHIYSQCPSVCDQNANNAFVGHNAGQAITTGGSNSFFGFDAGGDNTEGGSNSFFGRSAGSMITTSSHNSFFGNSAGRNNTDGSANSFFGSQTGNANTTGSNNSFFGRLAGTTNTIGDGNVFFGTSAGRLNLDGNSNAFFGYLAGFDNSSGSFNSFFGRSAGANLLGSRNICIGNQSGPEPVDSNSSDRLYIDVETSSDPLIYGEFDNDFVRINGTFEVTAGLMNSSAKNLKTDFTTVEHKAILEKLVGLDISEWTYKDQPGTIHIGPVAEDFHTAFGYGSTSQIYTIDADGVTMAAIKAVHEENLRQHAKLDQLESEIAALKNLLKENGIAAKTAPD